MLHHRKGSPFMRQIYLDNCTNSIVILIHDQANIILIKTSGFYL